jgi:dTDP-4-dehydrorhamnose 3,5-epimerase-like enzyme
MSDPYEMRIKSNKVFETKGVNGLPNGFLVPIYNVHEGFHALGMEPKQVYLTVVAKGQIKGPHLHYIRTGCFTCIKGNARIVLKTVQGYEVVYSGEGYEYKSVIVPAGTPAALQALGEEDAYILNMPTPAWTPDMNDEHSADFSDFDFSC